MTTVTLLHLLFFLLLLPISIIAQGYRNISLGSSLTATGEETSWLSPSGDFAVGFHSLDKDHFLLAIWFDKIPEKTVTWYANGDKPAPRGSKVQLTTDGKLVLNDPQGKEIWAAAPVSGAVSYAAMLDNGNFVLGSRSSSDYPWESFKNPTDTILPTQTMEVNSMLYSRQTENNYSKGRFRLRLLEDGNLVLNVAAFPSLTEVQYDAYYWSDTYKDGNRVNAGYKVVFNQSGYISVLIRNGSIVNLSSQNPVPSTDVYYRATIEFDGVFTLYSHPRKSSNNQVWSKVWSVPDNICVAIGGVEGSGACGYNSYCLLTAELRPRCECPPKFVFIDPNNRYSGCRPDFIQGCQLEEWSTKRGSYELETLEDIDWPTSDYERLETYSEEQCRTSCLNDCLCDVAIVRAGNCWKKKLPLSNGRYSSSMNGKALIKVRKDNSTQLDPYFPPSSAEKKDRFMFVFVGSLLLGSSVFFNFLLLGAVLLVFFIKDHKKFRKNYQEPSVVRSNLRSFTYQELEEATSGFKEQLGRGAFGIVYKGAIEEMGLKSYIAVKKLDKVVQEGEKEFKTEVSVIGQTHHKNLVRLLGFCDEGENRLLVYEFMNNSSLAEHLFGISKLEWTRRVQIAFGIARGLMYLHEECSTQIIHCDIKPQNILLDDCFTAKISDFGLAKLLMNEQTRTRTGIRGTRGYVAPEWFRRTPITVKVDVYSYGVMLLEILCCRKSIELELGGEEKSLLTDWAYDSYKAGKLQDLVDNDEDAMNDIRRLERLVMIAIWCIQEEPSFRPTMKKVTQMLEGVLDVPVPPCPCPLSASSKNDLQLI